jgi:hypothetical protein
MKYIIFKDNKSGLIMPIVFNEHVTHSQVKVEGATAISAGFCNSTCSSIYGKSDSLKLSPGINDLEYLNGFTLDMSTSYFVDYEAVYNARHKPQTDNK